MDNGWANTAIQDERRLRLRLQKLHHLPNYKLIRIRDFLAAEIDQYRGSLPDSTLIISATVQSILSER